MRFYMPKGIKFSEALEKNLILPINFKGGINGSTHRHLMPTEHQALLASDYEGKKIKVYLDERNLFEYLEGNGFLVDFERNERSVESTVISVDDYYIDVIDKYKRYGQTYTARCAPLRSV